jgi:hypothetical protein
VAEPGSAPAALPPSGAPAGGAPVPGAWRPPALQPGIVPLRPLGLGEILDGAVRAIRANPRVMFGLAAVVVTVTVALQAVVRWYLTPILTGQLADALSGLDTGGAFSSGSDGTNLSELYGSSLGQFAATPLTLMATTVLTGLLIVSVSRSVLGEQISGREVLRSSRVWWVLGFTALTAATTLLVFGGWVAAVFWLGSNESLGPMVAVALLGGALIVVGSTWFTTRTLLVPAALMLEGRTFWTTVARAWRLTRGSFWRLFGINLLTGVLVGVVSGAITAPVQMISSLVTGDPTGASPAALAIGSIGQAVALTLATTYQAAVLALLYIDVRMRREGLDLDLAQAAAGRAR